MTSLPKMVMLAGVMLAVGIQPAAASTHDLHSARAGHTASGKLGKAARAQDKVHRAMHKAMMVQYVGDPDTDFVRGMVPHHQGAVDMANVVLAYGKDAEIRKLAQWIVQIQKTEIAMMKRWLHTKGYAQPVERRGGKETIAAFDRIMGEMHCGMNIRYTNNADVDFVRGMIPHHQGAVDMALALLDYSTDPELRELARGIIGSQRQEIALMQRWLEKNDVKAQGKK